MSLAEISKREHCPKCHGVTMSNYVHVASGRDVEVFVECAACSAFVARYTLKLYTSDCPYRSFLRWMRSRRMASGGATMRDGDEFTRRLTDDWRRVKELVAKHEEQRPLEDVMGEVADYFGE